MSYPSPLDLRLVSSCWVSRYKWTGEEEAVASAGVRDESKPLPAITDRYFAGHGERRQPGGRWGLCTVLGPVTKGGLPLGESLGNSGDPAVAT